MTEIDELLPCPFCGARLQRQQTSSGHWYEHMGEAEDCYATGSIVFDENIPAWNRRSPSPVSVGVKVVAQAVALEDCPIGLFLYGDTLALKTEYGSNEGRIDAYIVSSGEFFWGSAPQTIASQRATLVTPVSTLTLSPAGVTEEGVEAAARAMAARGVARVATAPGAASMIERGWIVYADDARAALEAAAKAQPSISTGQHEDTWRDLALQFDGHRIEALSMLRCVADAANQEEVMSCIGAIKEFLAKPPLSGEEVLTKRIASVSTGQGETVADTSFPDALRDSEIRIWINACNHEPARQALRQLLAYRVRGPSLPAGHVAVLLEEATTALAWKDAELAEAASAHWRIPPNMHIIPCEANGFVEPDPFEGVGETYADAYTREKSRAERAEARLAEALKALNDVRAALPHNQGEGK